jgi:hypothetical protein
LLPEQLYYEGVLEDAPEIAAWELLLELSSLDENAGTFYLVIDESPAALD